MVAIKFRDGQYLSADGFRAGLAKLLEYTPSFRHNRCEIQGVIDRFFDQMYELDNGRPTSAGGEFIIYPSFDGDAQVVFPGIYSNGEPINEN